MKNKDKLIGYKERNCLLILNNKTGRWFNGFKFRLVSDQIRPRTPHFTLKLNTLLGDKKYLISYNSSKCEGFFSKITQSIKRIKL